MLFKPGHIYLKIKTNHVWVKHLESQSVVEVNAERPLQNRPLLY
jgi:hypothetical protein